MLDGEILHYRILRYLGAGSMGEAYLAEDQRVGRRVVLKFLAPGHASDPHRLERLKQEARALAALRHPNIAGLHALQTEWTQPFLALEYVDGETLHDVLELGPLPPADVARIGLAIASALEHAHARGIVHRDIKPENILIGMHDDIRLTDFGIASTGHDRTGDIYGTADYMSPEQARGELLDGRSDLFSLGVVLYEALTGTRPFRADDAPAPGHGDARGNVVSARAVAPDTPVALDDLITRCLATDRARRPRDAATVVDVLQTIVHPTDAAPRPSARPLAPWVRVALAGGALAAAVALLPVLDQRPIAPDRDTVLVLPIDVRGPAQGGEWVGRAFASAIAEHLVRDASVHAVGGERAPDVRWVLRGSVQRDGEIMAARFTLLDASSHRVLWETRRTTEDGAFPRLASDVARDLSDALGAQPPSRYDYFLHRIVSPALAGSALTSEALGLSRRYDAATAPATRRLVEAFPSEPEALVLHAYALLGEYWETNGPSPARAEFERTLNQLEEADPDNPWPAAIRGSVAHRNGDLDAAVRHFDAVLARVDLAVGARAYVLSLRGQALRDLDRLEPALADLEHAVRLDATNDVNLVILSEALRLTERLDESVERARQALALAPHAAYVQYVLGLALIGRGDYAAAVPPLRDACRTSPSQSRCATLALALLRAGDVAAARTEAARATALPSSDWGSFQLSRYHAARGDGATALRLLRRSFDLGYKDPEIKVIREFEAIRTEPEFVAMVDEIRERSRGVD